MRLLRDVWAVSPRSTVALAALVVVGALGSSVAAACAGPVLVRHSWAMFALLAVALTANVSSQVATGLVAARVSADWSADLRRRLCRSALGQSVPALEGTPVGELLDRIDGDCYQVASEVRGSGLRLAQSLAFAALSIGTALLVWWPAGVAMVLVVAGLAVGMRHRVGAIGVARMAEEEAWSDLAAVVEEAVHGQDDVRTALARPYVLRLYAERASAVLARGRRVWRLGADVTARSFGVALLAVIGLVVGGAWALAAGRVDPARLTSVWLLASSFGVSAEHVARMVPELQYALGAWERIRLLADVPQEPAGGRRPRPGDLRIHGLTFGYDDEAAGHGRGPVLRDVSLTFRRGRSYALVGRTGSGKSTLTRLLSRAVDVPRGTVFLGDTDLVDLDLEQLRRWVAVVPQRTDILAGTVRENIALFDRALYDDVGPALSELGLDGWVAELPEGLDTRLGEGGSVLSAGQEQLVAFARILVRRPEVVVLDEATARLDPATEARVQQAAMRLLHGRIGILVAHRLSSVRRCDEVVVLADGRVVEAGPLATSRRFAELLAAGDGAAGPGPVGGAAPLPDVPRQWSVDAEPVIAAGGGVLVAQATVGGSGAAGPPDRPDPFDDGSRAEPSARVRTSPAARPVGPEPSVSVARTLREIARLVTNDARYGLAAVALWSTVTVLGLNGSLLPVLWDDLVDGTGTVLWPAAGIVAALLVVGPAPWFTGRWFPQWWVRQMLRISLRLVHGQTGARRRSRHTPAEVVAQGGDTERVVVLADHVIDQGIAAFAVLTMTLVSRSVVPGLFFVSTMALSGAAATLFGRRLAASARHTVAARAAFATALVSSLSAARTVKLAGATGPVLDHLARLDRERSVRQRREIVIQVWARSTPFVVSGLLPVGAWALYLTGRLPGAATLVAVSTLASANWFAWTTASLVSQLPSARVWTRRTVEMCGLTEYSSPVAGVDLSAGTAPAPDPAPRSPLERLDLVGFTAVHDDGTVGVHGVDLVVRRGEFVLVVGPVGSGKSSLLRALAGIVRHTGDLRWNGERVTEPELFLRPGQVGYVGQLPRVLSGTIAENVALGHDVDAAEAVAAAQLERDLAAAGGGGLGLLIGHKGTRLSGGQLQRLALARALARRTELLVADDVSSALDVTTELAVWSALRERGVTVVGATSKRAALRLADTVVVLVGGRCVDRGPWHELEERWGHLGG